MSDLERELIALGVVFLLMVALPDGWKYGLILVFLVAIVSKPLGEWITKNNGAQQ